MAVFTTALGETYAVQRRLPRLAWRPRYRGADPSYADFTGAADDSILGLIGAVLFAITLVVVVLPFLLFVVEVAVVVAIVIPVVVFALAIGLVSHTVVVRAGASDGPVVAARRVRGVVASWQTARELRAAAESGEYRSAASAALVRGEDVAPPV